MKVVAFIGPTIGAQTVSEILPAECRPPAKQGDIHLAVRDGAEVIGLVDGYFEGQPAVLHKEILWALHQGVEVFGSASMGALRAAELDAFGMQGVGKIFEGYLNQLFEDDDEVALLHGPEELGYPPVTLAMVDLRATVQAALTENLLTKEEAERLVEAAKAIHYKDRSWDAVLAGCDLPPGKMGEPASTWLPRRFVNQKRLDALEMFRAISDYAEGRRPSWRKDFQFEWTDVWNDLVSTCSKPGASAGQRTAGGRALDELRLDPLEYDRQVWKARYRRLALDASPMPRSAVDEDLRQEQEEAHRMRQGLFRRSDQNAWLQANALTAETYHRLLKDEARIEALESDLEGLLEAALLDQLKLEGAFAPLALRAEKKLAVLKDLSIEDPAPEDTDKTPAGLLHWFFKYRGLGTPPDDLSPLLRRLGLSSKAEFYRMIAREYLYLKAGGD